MDKKSVNAQRVKEHFDSLADSYDAKKNKNWYYYESLKKSISSMIPEGKRVLEIGTGTGELLHSLNPSDGVGIDLSPKMIDHAQAKFPVLEFESCSYETFRSEKKFEYILLADVIEHLESPESLFEHLKKFCAPTTQIVLTMANPLWDPFLEILENLHLKMKEGPHHRVSEKDVIRFAETQGFRLLSKSNSVFLPIHIPLMSTIANRYLAKFPILNRWCLIMRFVFQKTSTN